MILPTWLLLFLLVLGALVAFGGVISAYWLMLWWWRDLMWMRTLRRWDEWGGVGVRDHFYERMAYRAIKALRDAKRTSPDNDREQAMAVATAVHDFITNSPPYAAPEDRT